MTPNTVGLLLDDLLKACVDAYAALEVAHGPPQRQLKTHGQTPAADGEQLVVSCTSVRPARPFPATDIGPQYQALIPAADLSIWLWRACWPTADSHAQQITLPTPDAIAEAAARLAEDASTLFAYVSQLAVTGTLFPSVAGLGVGAVTVQSMVPLEPSGKLAGWRWPLTVKLAIR